MPANLGEKLKAIRLHLGLTQEEMAKAVGKEGISRRARISEWEAGIREPDLDCLLGYARLANVTTDELLDDNAELPLK